MRVIKSGFEILSKIDGMEILKSLKSPGAHVISLRTK